MNRKNGELSDSEKIYLERDQREREYDRSYSEYGYRSTENRKDQYGRPRVKNYGTKKDIKLKK